MLTNIQRISVLRHTLRNTGRQSSPFRALASPWEDYHLSETGIYNYDTVCKVTQYVTEFCQEKALVIQNTLFQQHKR